MPQTAAARDAVALPLAATLLLLAILLGSAGCTLGPAKPEPVSPTSPEGKACLQRCELPKTQCQQRQEARETECGAIYATARADYDLCIKSGSARCKAPYTCLGADLSICDQQYDDCFSDCAGRAERQQQPAGGGETASQAGATAEPEATGHTGGARGAGAIPAKMDPP